MGRCMKEETGMDSRIQPFAEKMRKTYESMEEDFKTVRAGRANPAVLSRVRVEYYGSEVPVSQVGNIMVPEARILQIAPWEPSMVKAIIKAINMSDIGINPTTDGKVIRLIFPELTEERRKELSKEVKKKGEAAKVAIRNIRRDADGLISFDFMGGTSDIRGIMADSDPTDLEYFDLQGRKVSVPSRGIYIIRNKKTNKTYKSSF